MLLNFLPQKPIKLFILLLVGLLLLPAGFAAHARTLTSTIAFLPAEIRLFQQVAPGEGWLVLNGRLFWTGNDGAIWSDITPAQAGEDRIEAVTFLNRTQGRVLLAVPSATPSSYILASTADSGRSWDRKPLEFAALAASPSPVSAVYTGWLDEQTGWLVFKFATGSNFSRGVLYTTQDAGITWALRTIPLGEPASFATPQLGWVAGGPAGNQLFRTLDGGRTWAAQRVVEGGYYSLPRFENEKNGLLPVVTAREGQPSAAFYQTRDGGQNWSLLARVPLDAGTPPTTRLPLALLGPRDFVLVVPKSGQAIQGRDGQLEYHQHARAGDIVDLSMSTLEFGWGASISAACEPAAGKLNCTRQMRLLSTDDGGGHWMAISLPGASGNSLQEGFSIADKTVGASGAAPLFSQDPDTQPYVGQGFDSCQVPSIDQLQTWWNRSPYNAVNLYIGGSSRACANSVLSASYLSQLNAQGWRFIPTWVGPQASCSWYLSRMSSNVVIAYNQGINEADMALSVAVSLGLTGANKAGTAIYYDLEAYDINNSDCRAAANAFISGWVHEMHAYDNPGAVYGASCGSAPTDWNSIANVPDALWVANWYGSAGTVQYDRDASVWGAYCLSDSLWSNHQRLRQYAGDHYETWGGLTLEIDSDVFDGLLSVPNGSATSEAPAQPTPIRPANAAILNRTSDTWLAWKTNGDSCSLHVWGGNTNITTPVNCQYYHLGVRAGGAYSWRITASNAVGTTAGPVWHFGIRPYPASALSAAAASATKVNLTWAFSADEPSNIDGYAIYMDGTRVATVLAGVSSYQVTNLGCITTHSFHVTAVRQGVESNPGSTVSATTPSCAPVISSPLEGSLTDSLRPTFSWQSVADTTKYNLQLSLYPDFSSLVISKSVVATTTTIGMDLARNTTYYWRVRARGPFGAGDWSAPTSFVTANPPSIPVLGSPASGALVRNYTPRLNWGNVTLPVGTALDHYEIRLSTDARFVTTLYDQSVMLSEFTVPAALAPNTVYYWQVRAFNTLNQYSSWSTRFYFRTVLLPPVLNSPASGFVPLSLRPVLDWNDVSGASSYTVQLSKLPDFSVLYLSAAPAASVFVPKPDLPANSLFYWRVQANGDNGPSAWSPVWTFTTPRPPGVPVLLSPVSNVLITDYTPLLDWRTSKLPLGTTFDHYQVQVARDTAFTRLVLDQNLTDRLVSEYTVASALTPGSKYFWRVRAFNTLGQYSSWSTKAGFRTVILPPDLLSPVDGAVTSQLMPVFDWTDVATATSYTIEVATDASFSVRMLSVIASESTYTPASALPLNVPLYWHVRTDAPNGPSAWSATYQFTIVP